MLFVKFLLGAAIVAFCTFLGYLFAGKYRARKSFFFEANAFNEKFLAELKFSRKPVGEFFKTVNAQGDFARLTEAAEAGGAAAPDFSFLSKSEKDFVSEYFSMLGKGDSASQLGYFSAQEQILKEKLFKSEKEAKERSELYTKLGLLFGLAFVILIV